MFFLNFVIKLFFFLQGLKDLDYIIQEKTILEYVLDFEFDSSVTESEDFFKASIANKFSIILFTFFFSSFSYNQDRGTFYMDKGHSFDSILFYGNEQLLFQIEILLFICLIVISGNFLFAILLLGIVSEVFTIYKFCYLFSLSLLHKSNLMCLFADTEAYNAFADQEEFIKSNINR